MEEIFEQEYEGVDFSKKPLQKANYEACTFSHCNFKEVDLRSFEFIDCVFEHCDMSMLKMPHTKWRDCEFTDCKMLGLHFDHADHFLMSFHFINCRLDESIFNGLSLKAINFLNCNLLNVDYTDCNLKDCSFERSNLEGAKFSNTQLEGSNFIDAYNFKIIPEHNLLKKTIFSRDQLEGLLTQYDIIIK